MEKKKNPAAPLIFILGIVISFALLFIVYEFIFLLNQEGFDKVFLPKISYWKIAAAIILLSFIYWWCDRCWYYKRTGFFDTPVFWVVMIFNFSLFLVSFIVGGMCFSKLFFNAPNYQNTLSQCKTIVVLSGIVLFWFGVYGKSFKKHKKIQKDMTENPDQ